MISEREARAAILCFWEWLWRRGKDPTRMSAREQVALLPEWDQQSHDELHEFFHWPRK